MSVERTGNCPERMKATGNWLPSAHLAQIRAFPDSKFIDKFYFHGLSELQKWVVV